MTSQKSLQKKQTKKHALILKGVSGRGCAKALADEGATVYITGRKIETLSQTAREIGGDVIPVACDHSDDNQGKWIEFSYLTETSRKIVQKD